MARVEVHWDDGVERFETEFVGREMVRPAWNTTLGYQQERIPFHHERKDGTLVYAARKKGETV